MREPLARRDRPPPSSSSAGSASCSPCWAAMHAFRIYQPLVAAGLVLLMMNVVTVLPVLARQRRPRAGGGRGLARPVRRRLRARLRLRDRAPGDRGVGRDRDRDGLPRAGGALLRDAEDESESRPTTTSEPARSGLRRSPCPASLKGVLSPADAAAALAAGMRRVPGWEVDELPVADGGEGTAEVLRRALGGELALRRASRIRSADRCPRASSSCPTARRSSIGRGGRALAARARGARSTAGLERRARRASAGRARGGSPRRCSSASAGRRRSTAARVSCVHSHAGPCGVPLRIACDVRNPLLGARGAARVFGPQKGADPEAVEMLEQRLAAMAELRARPGSAGRRCGRRARGGIRSRSAVSWSTAPSSCSIRSASTSVPAAPPSRSPARGRSMRRRSKARRPARSRPMRAARGSVHRVRRPRRGRPPGREGPERRSWPGLRSTSPHSARSSPASSVSSARSLSRDACRRLRRSARRRVRTEA